MQICFSIKKTINALYFVALLHFLTDAKTHILNQCVFCLNLIVFTIIIYFYLFVNVERMYGNKPDECPIDAKVIVPRCPLWNAKKVFISWGNNIFVIHHGLQNEQQILQQQNWSAKQTTFTRNKLNMNDCSITGWLLLSLCFMHDVCVVIWHKKYKNEYPKKHLNMTIPILHLHPLLDT